MTKRRGAEPAAWRPVLVGVGEGDDTFAAVRYGAALAVREKRPLMFVHVRRRPSPVFPEEMLVSYQAAALVAEDLVAAAAEKAERLVQGAVAVERRVVDGSRVDALVSLADAARVVVLQHRSRHGLARIVTGSVVVGVAGRTSVPVVSVPDRWVAPAVVARVGVAVDGRAENGSLLEEAFRLASESGAGLTVLHAWFLGTAYDEVISSRTPLEQWSELAHRHVVTSLQDLAQRYPEVDVRVQVRHERPADAVVGLARHSDLLLVGRRSHPHRTHLGPVARAAVLEAACPVVVVPLEAGLPADEGAVVDVRESVPS